SLEVAYVIPKPLDLVLPIVLADEQGKTELPLTINLPSALIRQKSLIIEVGGRRIRMPLTSTSLQFRCPLQGLSTSVRIWLDNAPKWAIGAKVILPL
ncbi:MAG: hypothetical protein NZ937_02835, partial [Armatimonadetes bacterium]|nr:hypothetical protein [Armatimonadota bacterium]